MLSLFLQGLIMGVVIAAPIGPISLLCIQRALTYGLKIGIITALGIAFADLVYASLAASGLTVIIEFLNNYKETIEILGGVFLILFGFYLIKKKTDEINLQDNYKKSSSHAFITSFLFTSFNPVTILSFIAVFASFGLDNVANNATYLVVGIASGSALWGILLSGSVVYFLRKRLTTPLMRKINYISGLLIFSFGFFSIIY
jgi:threonine/homoserine/homoserine lactone efflux protein